jgi:hypothetical protein
MLAGVAVALFLLPFPSRGQLKRLTFIAMTRARIVIVGPSTFDYVSICDQDKRTVPDMLAKRTGLSVLDLSVGGQPLTDSINLAAASGNAASISDIVLPLLIPQIDDWTTPPYRELVVYKAVSPRFEVFAADSLAEFWQGLTEKPSRLEQGYSFDGKVYPDYRVLAAGVFAREKDLMTCPETVTHDAEFLRSYLWWTHVAATRNQSLFGLVANLKADLTERGKRLHVVLLPANLELIGQISPAWRPIVEDKQRRLIAGLANVGVGVVDLSNLFPSSEFSSQWCACTHLSQSGRLHLARAIAQDIQSPFVPSSAASGRQ